VDTSAENVGDRLSELQTQLHQLSAAVPPPLVAPPVEPELREPQAVEPPAPETLQSQAPEPPAAEKRDQARPQGPSDSVRALNELTKRCNDVLDRWAATDARHQQAIGDLEARLSGWTALETRLQQESRLRMTEIERTIEREWQMLRQIHQAPVDELREQAATLGETCVTAARLALRGFERAESRLAALESDLQARMTQLSHDVQSLLAGTHESSLPRPHSLTPFPLERVMRIHEELRTSEQGDPRGAQNPNGRIELHPYEAGQDGGGAPSNGTAVAMPVNGHHGPPLNGDRRLSGLDAFHRSHNPAADAASPSLVRNMPAPTPAAALPPAQDRAPIDAAPVRAAESRQSPGRRMLTVAGAVAAIVILLAIVLERRISSQLDTAASRVTAAERQAAIATDTASRTRSDADRQVAEARLAAAQSQTVTSVLASPDLRRFSLSGRTAAPQASAQVLFSRSRGLVVSASRLPVTPAGSSYQVWLMTANGTVNVGQLEPDKAGRATLAIDVLPRIAAPVTGGLVTVEPPGRRATPAGAAALAYVPQ